MRKASRWTIRTRFVGYGRETNLAVLLTNLGIDEDMGENETGEVQSIISAVADSMLNAGRPCMVEAYHDGSLLLASKDHRGAGVAL